MIPYREFVYDSIDISRLNLISCPAIYYSKVPGVELDQYLTLGILTNNEKIVIYDKRTDSYVAILRPKGVTFYANSTIDSDRLNQFIHPYRLESIHEVWTVSKENDVRLLIDSVKVHECPVLDDETTQAVKIARNCIEECARSEGFLEALRGADPISMCDYCNQLSASHLMTHISRQEIGSSILAKLIGASNNFASARFIEIASALAISTIVGQKVTPCFSYELLDTYYNWRE